MVTVHSSAVPGTRSAVCTNSPRTTMEAPVAALVQVSAGARTRMTNLVISPASSVQMVNQVVTVPETDASKSPQSTVKAPWPWKGPGGSGPAGWAGPARPGTGGSAPGTGGGGG